jgi:hypothetical protein
MTRFTADAGDAAGRSGGWLMRGGLIAYAFILYLFAGGFFFREWWATDFWPFSYTNPMSYIFVASILAAAASSILYCAVWNDLRAMSGIGLDAVVITLPVAVLAFTSGRASLHTFGILAGVMAVAGVVAAVWFQRYSFRDPRPTPNPVRISFGLFIVALWVSGGALAAGSQRILPWEVTPEVARIYGWIFIGASSYFLYGLIVPRWSNAAGQLLGFLAYDLVLIVPFILFFRHVAPERMINHIVYTTAVVYSGAVAVYYCWVHPSTRLVGGQVK